MIWWNERVNQSCNRISPGSKIRHLIEQLADPDERTYVEAGRRLILFGASAVNDLIDALEDERCWILVSVLLEQIWARLNAIGETIDDDEVDKLILMAVEQRSIPVRDWIVSFLRKIDTPRIRQGLHDLLGVEDDQYVATTALLEIYRRELNTGKYRLL